MNPIILAIDLANVLIFSAALLACHRRDTREAARKAERKAATQRLFEVIGGY